MIHAAHIDVVHVQQNQAVRALRDLGQEVPLGELRGRVADVAGDVLQQNPGSQAVLHPADPIDDVSQYGLVVRQRQQVMQIAAGHPGPAQMIGNPGRLHAPLQPLQPGQMLLIERIRAADRKRHAVHRDRIVGSDPVQPMQGPAARNHEILAGDLEPAHLGPGLDNLGVMRRAQSEPEAERIPHRPAVGAAYFDIDCDCLAFSQSCGVNSLKPWPLQEFCPLQEFFADAQSLLPLQLLTPSQ